MKLIKEVIHRSAWLLIGNIAARSAAFLSNIIAARLLSQELFGQFALLRNSISSIEGIISGALGPSIIKRVSEICHKDKNKIGRIFAIIIITDLLLIFFVAAIFFANSDFIIKHLFIDQKEILLGLQIGTLLLISTNISSLMQSIMIGLEEFKKLTFAGLASSCVAIPLIFFFTYFFSIYGAIFGLTLYFFLDFLFKYLIINKITNFCLYYFFEGLFLFWREGKKILIFSVPIFFSMVISNVTPLFGRYLVVNSSGGFSDIAVFDAAFQWLTMIMIATGATTSVALPMLSKAFGNKSLVIMKSIFKINLTINFAISVFIASAFSFFAKEIMAIYGENYAHGYKLLVILCFASVAFTLSSVLNKYVIAINNSWIVFISSLVGAISFIAVLVCTIQYREYSLAFGYLAFYLSSALTYFLKITYFKDNTMH
ncbi:oligosaccharide flippase family protein [Allochromatium humboldtianum]|uniref:Oligosaccharide flippase family protein n=1 Tax=Allochromatium humboldtianum TaxID=504901 RepID=A0A850R6S4_9GAMM|nr:oligosaccharide flippase family protein [Allochromatium humboldtianum]